MRNDYALPPALALPIAVQHTGRSDQGIIAVFWPTSDTLADLRLSAALDVGATILRDRLIDGAREKLGLTYTPSVISYQDVDLKGLGYFGASIETPRTNFEQFRLLVLAQIADLSNTPVSTDELERARRPIEQQLIRAKMTDGWWLNYLSALAYDPRQVPLSRHSAAACRKSVIGGS